MHHMRALLGRAAVALIVLNALVWTGVDRWWSAGIALAVAVGLDVALDRYADRRDRGGS
ncbi:hypothetical protein [Streptomyces sp. 058-1L]|uniref:hypothetical protein n=1 Tax=Streptomyces sp. 058-1L TaxID=2789266 RepID=UPI00397F074A